MSSPNADDINLQEVQQVTATKRFSDDVLLTVLVWLYMPIGICVCLVRIFILLHVYVISVILCRLPTLRRFICRAMGFILGLIATEGESNAGRDDRTNSTESNPHVSPDRSGKLQQLVVSNHISPFDFLAVESVTRVSSSLLISEHDMFHWFGTCIPRERVAAQSPNAVRDVTQLQRKRNAALFILPERVATNGSVGVLRFDESLFCDFLARKDSENARPVVQPIAIRYWRPFPFDCVALHVHDASRWTDLFWLLAVPFTVFRVTTLPPLHVDAETTQSAAKRSAEVIARALEIRVLDYSHVELHRALARRKNPRLVRQVDTTARNSPLSSTSSSNVTTKTRQAEFDEVKSILPQVREDRIWKALVGNSVEQAISLLLEDPTAIAPAESQPTQADKSSNNQPSGTSTDMGAKCERMKFVFGDSRFGKKPQDRQMSFEQRKRALVEAARSKYLEKHGNASL